jgi:hypothetical protein
MASFSSSYIGHDHINRLYNWHHRTEQKKQNLKKKLAKEETPSFTPKKYTRARKSRPVYTPTESNAIKKHRERLNRARKKEHEKQQVHVHGNKWTGKSTKPKAPTLSYQTRSKKNGNAQHQQNLKFERANTKHNGYNNIHNNNMKKKQVAKTSMNTSSISATYSISEQERSNVLYSSLSKKATATIDTKRKRVPVAAVPIVRQLSKSKTFINTAETVPSTDNKLQNNEEDNYDTYSYQHKFQLKNLNEESSRQPAEYVHQQYHNYTEKEFDFQQQLHLLPEPIQHVQYHQRIESSNEFRSDLSVASEYHPATYNISREQQNPLQNTVSEMNSNSSNINRIINNNNIYEDKCAIISNNDARMYEKKISPDFKPKSYSDFYNEKNYVYQPISLPPPPNTEVTVDNNGGEIENDNTVANKTKLEWEYVQRKTKFLTDRAKEKSDQLETKLKRLEFENKKLLGLVPENQLVPNEDTTAAVIKRTRSEKNSLKGHYRRMSKAAVIQTTKSGKDHVSTMGTAKRM